MIVNIFDFLRGQMNDRNSLTCKMLHLSLKRK